MGRTALVREGVGPHPFGVRVHCIPLEGEVIVNKKVAEDGEGGYVVRLTEAEFSLIISALWTHWNENQSTEEGREADALSDRLTD